MSALDRRLIGEFELHGLVSLSCYFSKNFHSGGILSSVKIPDAMALEGGELVVKVKLRLPDDIGGLVGKELMVSGGVIEVLGNIPGTGNSSDSKILMEVRDEEYVYQFPGKSGGGSHHEELVVRLDYQLEEKLLGVLEAARKADQAWGDGGLIEKQAERFIVECVTDLSNSSNENLEGRFMQHGEGNDSSLYHGLRAIRWYLNELPNFGVAMKRALSLHERSYRRFMVNVTNGLFEFAAWLAGGLFDKLFDYVGKRGASAMGFEDIGKALKDGLGAYVEGSVKVAKEELEVAAREATEAMAKAGTELEEAALAESRKLGRLSELRDQVRAIGDQIGDALKEGGEISAVTGLVRKQKEMLDEIREIPRAIAKQLGEAQEQFVLQRARQKVASDLAGELDGLLGKGIDGIDGFEEVLQKMAAEGDSIREVLGEGYSAVLEQLTKSSEKILPVARQSYSVLSDRLVASDSSLESARKLWRILHQGRTAPSSKIKAQLSKTIEELTQQSATCREALGRLSETTGLSPVALQTTSDIVGREIAEKVIREAEEPWQFVRKGVMDPAVSKSNDVVKGFFQETEGVMEDVVKAEPAESIEGDRAHDMTSRGSGVLSWLGSVIYDYTIGSEFFGSKMRHFFFQSGVGFRGCNKLIELLAWILSKCAAGYNSFVDLVVLRPIEGFGNWWGSEDSMVLEGAANVRSMRRLLETKGKINPAFFNCLPPEANGVFEQTRLENLVRAKTDGRDRIRKSMQKSAVGATKKYQVRQLECASMALAELSGSTMAMSRLEKNVVLPYRWESEDDNQVLTAVNRVSDEFEESFTVIEGGKGTMADAAAAFNRYTTKKGDQLFANDVDMVIDWLAWIMVWGIRISVLGGMLLAAATTGPVGIVAGAATGMGVLKIADYVEKGAAALRVGIVGLWTVPFAFQLQRDVLFAAAQTYDEVFEQGNL